MPELPEVETIRKTLNSLILNKKITDVIVKYPKIIKRPDDKLQFIDAMIGESFLKVERRGKFLLFETENYTLVSHLRMEGKYGLFMNEDEMDKHSHVIFQFEEGEQLRYTDVRKFGTMHLFAKGTELQQLPLSQLGPEPFEEEFTVEFLQDKLSKTRRHIKTALLDQTIFVGLGNIYVDEALFRSNIHPETPSNQVSAKQIALLYEEIKATLAEAIEKGGSTIRSYVSSDGEMGMFQLQHFVYGRDGENCRSCETVIEKTRVNGRGTHYCPKCQKQ